MERGMKSDKTEVILLGAAAAVIALIVAFSMMDKGKKRSREDEEAETARNVREKVDNDVDELEETNKKLESNLKTAEDIVQDLKSAVPLDSTAGRLVAKAESAIERAKPVVKTLNDMIPDKTKESFKDAAIQGGKRIGEWAFNQLKDAATKSLDQNAPWRQKPKEIPLPSNFRPTNRPRDDRRNSW